MSRALPAILSLLALACSASKSPSDTPSNTTEHVDEPVTPEPSPPPDDPGTEQPSAGPESGSVKLTHFGTELEVTTGTELRYSFKSHASVGYGAELEIGDPKVLRHLRTDTDYEQSEQERAGKTGADAATGTFVFEAIAPGRSTLKVAETFRGTTELEINYTITVVEP